MKGIWAQHYTNFSILATFDHVEVSDVESTIFNVEIGMCQCKSNKDGRESGLQVHVGRRKE